LKFTSTWAFFSTLTWSSALTLSTLSFSAFSNYVHLPWHVAKVHLAPPCSLSRRGSLSSKVERSSKMHLLAHWCLIPDGLSFQTRITHLNSSVPPHLLGLHLKARVAHVVPWVRTPPQPCQSQARRSGNCSCWALCALILSMSLALRPNGDRWHCVQTTPPPARGRSPRVPVCTLRATLLRPTVVYAHSCPTSCAAMRRQLMRPRLIYGSTGPTARPRVHDESVTLLEVDQTSAGHLSAHLLLGVHVHAHHQGHGDHVRGPSRSHRSESVWSYSPRYSNNRQH